MASDSLPVISFKTSAAWESWLRAEHASSPGVWLKIAKKSADAHSVSYAEALAIALCYGWIDGQKGRLDDDYWLQRFTPRTARSRWSLINTDKASALIEAARMQPAGLHEVELARADGRWDAAYQGQRSITVPADLERALAASDAARAFFETISSVNRYAILYRIGDARRPETRARRIAQYVAMLEAGKTLHP
jgi:uncharacterized protein YdeI (YjbR/CyaY-like superfamily)